MRRDRYTAGDALRKIDNYKKRFARLQKIISHDDSTQSKAARLMTEDQRN